MFVLLNYSFHSADCNFSTVRFKIHPGHSKSGESLIRNDRLIDTQIIMFLSALIAVTVDSLKSQYHKIDRKNVADYLTYIIQ